MKSQPTRIGTFVPDWVRDILDSVKYHEKRNYNEIISELIVNKYGTEEQRELLKQEFTK